MTEDAPTLQTRARLLVVEGDRIALVRRERGGTVYYLLPGGGVEPGESPEDAAIREAYEELGVHVELDRLRYDETFGGQRLVYFDAHIVGGRFGTGAWPDVAALPPGRAAAYGRFDAVWVELARLPSLDIASPVEALLAGRPVVRMDRLDHLVLTVRDVPATRRFYGRVLGLVVRTRPDGRTVLSYGRQSIHVHEAGREVTPHAGFPTPGSTDLCFVTAVRLGDVLEHLAREGVRVEIGPVERHGALGAMTSVYVRDPDLNLVEICAYA